ncbi:glycosyltransferase family 2 protein [Kocuria soli]|uniref:glycosyltransferase family 2 protein n=1 Tax=Kocuria soli TaxID=2485125 RepID=UPI001F1B27A9|nr:glycosyltransferase [Kocuria soli]
MDDSTRLSPVTVVIPHYGDPAQADGLIHLLLGDDSDDGGKHAGPTGDGDRRTGEAGAPSIIVCDDASPSPFPLPWPSPERPDPRVQVIRRSTNGGFGAAVNTALAQVNTPLALVLNSDVVMTAEQVAELVRAAEPWQPAVASPAVTHPDGTWQWAGRQFPTIAHQVTEWLTPLARWRTHLHDAVGHDVRAQQSETTTPVDWVMGAAMLLPLAEVRAVGGFDEGFHMNCEEVDLQRRLRMRSVPSVLVPTVRVSHVGGGSSAAGKRREWLVESRFRYARKWGHPEVLRWSLRAATLVNFSVNGLRRLRGTPVRPVEVLRQEMGLLR